jgi:NADH-quinone oxidoreductase subunit E
MQNREADFSYHLWRYEGKPGELIPLLQSAQAHFGYIPRQAIKYISDVTSIPESDIFGVITFYSQFRLQPMGRHVIRLCAGTACHVTGAQTLLQTIEDELGIEVGGTTEDGLFTLFTVACLGCCSLAPAMLIDQETYGQLTPAGVRKIVRKCRREAKKQVAAESGVTKQ